MSGAQTFWTAYKVLLEGGSYAVWGDLWAGNGEFVVVYGDETVDGRERYGGVADIVAFISDPKEKGLISETRIFNDAVYPVEDRGDDFFCCFDIRIRMIDDEVYENKIVCRFTTEGGKIVRIVEYAHPVLRRRFVDHLDHLDALRKSRA